MNGKIGLLLLLMAATSPAYQPDRAALRHLFEESLTRRKQELGLADARTAQAARDLGLFLHRNGDTASARKALTETVALDEAAFGKSAPQTLEDVSTLAAISPPALAFPLLQRAAESGDPSVAGPALSSLAELRAAAGDRAGAAAYLRQAVEKAEAVDGKDGPIVALLLNTLALNVDAKKGSAFLERALQINRANFGERDARTVLTEVNLSKLMLASGRTNEAVAMARSSLYASEATFGTGHPATWEAVAALARATLAKGDKAEAEWLYRQALGLTQKGFGPADARTRRAAHELAALLRQVGKVAEADALDKR